MSTLSKKKVLLWDFDGTLGFRVGGMWSDALLTALYEIEPDNSITIDDVRPLLQKGFPWHQPEIAHTHLNTAKLWWDSVKTNVIIKAFMALGISDVESIVLADLTHQKYIDTKYWALYDDTLPTLQLLADKGWKHMIVSNHIPELIDIIQELGLSKYIDGVINSAIVGYEKPHPKIFRIALEKAFYPSEVWMIGDNFTADYLGAEAAGIKRILVHKQNKKAIHQCLNLSSIPEILETAHS